MSTPSNFLLKSSNTIIQAQLHPNSTTVSIGNRFPGQYLLSSSGYLCAVSLQLFAVIVSRCTRQHPRNVELSGTIINLLVLPVPFSRSLRAKLRLKWIATIFSHKNKVPAQAVFARLSSSCVPPERSTHYLSWILPCASHYSSQSASACWRRTTS
jgi:hypothetical protein